MSIENDGSHTHKPHVTPETAGSPWLAELFQRFAPVRQEAIDEGYSEEEINDAIDQAVAAVRLKQDQTEAYGNT